MKDRIVNRSQRRQEHPTPSHAFRVGANKALNVLTELKELEASVQLLDYVLKANVVYFVTLFEVYFRDMLDLIFKVCKPEIFISKIDKIHERKYKFSEILSLSSSATNPLDLLASSLNFQKWSFIEETFSLLLGVKSFKEEAKKTIWTVSKEVPAENAQEIQLHDDDFLRLERLLSMRHNFVHDPNPIVKIDEHEVMYELLGAATSVVVSCDICINEFISKNVKSEFLKNKIRL